MRRRTVIMLIAIVLGLIALLAAPVIPIRYSESWIDPVTGSEKSQTTWVFGLTRGPRYTVSPLETRLRQIGYSYTPAWQFLSRDQVNISSHHIEDGSAPPIYRLEVVLKPFVEVSTPDELRKFADTMQSGTEQQQKAAVDAAAAKALNAMASGK
jgi:hypothetical protein